MGGLRELFGVVHVHVGAILLSVCLWGFLMRWLWPRLRYVRLDRLGYGRDGKICMREALGPQMSE